MYLLLIRYYYYYEDLGRHQDVVVVYLIARCLNLYRPGMEGMSLSV